MFGKKQLWVELLVRQIPIFYRIIIHKIILKVMVMFQKKCFSCTLKRKRKKINNYCRTFWYGHVTSLIRYLCTDKILIHFLLKNLYNTDPL